jgi:hypothetical protein
MSRTRLCPVARPKGFTRLGLLAYLEAGDLDGVVMFDRDDLARVV